MVSYAQKHTRTNPANYPSCARSLARTRARAHTHRHAPTRSHRFAAKPSQLPIARTQTYQHAPTHWHRFAATFLERPEAEFAEQPARRQTTAAVLQEALRLQTELLEAAVEQACDSGFRVATRTARVSTCMCVRACHHLMTCQHWNGHRNPCLKRQVGDT